MPVIANDTQKPFKPMKNDGLQIAVCSHVVDMGLHFSDYGPKEQVAIVFELEQKRDDGKPYVQSQLFTKSLASKANLCKFLEMWRGVKFTKEELAGFDLEKLIGAGCYLNLVENPKEDKIYYKIAGISRLPKGMPVPVLSNSPPPDWISKKAEEGAKNIQQRDQEAHGSVSQPANESMGNGDDDLPF